MVLLMKRIHERPPPSKFQPQNILFSQFSDFQVWPGSISSWSLSLNKIHLQKCKLQLYSQRLDSSVVQMACFDSSSIFESCSKVPVFEVDRIRGNQVQRTDTTVEKEISGEPLMTMPIPTVGPSLSLWGLSDSRVVENLFHLLEKWETQSYVRFVAVLIGIPE